MEKLYKLVFDSANYGIAITDFQHLLLTVNAHLCKVTGYRTDELKGVSIFKLLPPKIRPKVSAMYRDIVKGIAHPERIINLISKEGELLMFSLFIQYVEDGEDEFFINTFKSVDASDRYVNLFKETEKAAKIGGWEIDLISRQPLISDVFRGIYDIGPDVQITIEESLSFYPPKYRSALNAALELAGKEGKPFHLDLQLISAKGKAKWVKITCNPLTVEGHTVKLYGTMQDITVEKQQQEFLRQLIDAIPNLIMVKDKEGRFMLVNKAFASFYDMEPEDITGKTNRELDLHSADVIERFDEEDKLLLAGKQNSIALEEKVEQKDGTECWFNTVKTPVVSEDGMIEQILVVATDITDQKVAALEIARSEAYLKAIFNSGAIGIFAIDKELRTIFFNDYHGQRHFEIHGWELKKGDFILTNSEMRDEFEPLFQRAFEGDTFVVEKVIPNFDGSSHWAEFSLSPIRMEGEIIGTLVMARDITTRKNTEQQVIDSEKRFRAIIENGFDCIILYNEKEEIQYASATVVKMFGYAEEEILGRKGAEFIHADDLEERNRHIAGIFQGKVKNILRQERIQHKDGHYLWIEVSITNMLDEPSVRAVVASFREITDRKLAEQKQKQALRKEKILNESLTKTNTELDQFVYSTSHNLRAPLTSILGVTHIIKSEERMAERAALINLIEKSIHQLDATIQEITDYARNNRTEVSVEPINFEKVISDTIESLKFMEGADRISVQYEIENHLPFHSDTRRLRIIFNNLLSNAIKYQNFKIAQPKIDIRVKRTGENVMIHIQDNGIGIRSDQQDKIFNMFYRATDRSAGAGLGLYIVKETLHKLEGTIKVNTTYGEGTKFTLKIPDLSQKRTIDEHLLY